MRRAICQRQLIFLYYDVEVHSLDYATAYCDVTIVPMAACFNDEKMLFLCPYTDDKFFILYLLHFTIVQQINGTLNRRLQAINLFLTPLKKPQAVLSINSSSNVQVMY